MGSREEPERKRRHVTNSLTASPSSQHNKVEISMLQHQNQTLAHQLDLQRNEIHSLEEKFCQLKSKQLTYDNSLASFQNAWDEVEDDLELLAVRANASINELKVFQTSSPLIKEDNFNSVAPEEIFLYRLLETGATESSDGSNGELSIDAALRARKAATIKKMEYLVEAIEKQGKKVEEISLALRDGLSTGEAGHLLQTFDDELGAEMDNLRLALEHLQTKQEDISSEIQLLKDSHIKDQGVIKQLAGDLEETLADLEASRRKLSALKSERDTVSSIPCSVPGAKPDTSDNKLGLRPMNEINELETALEETKGLASKRLDELRELQQEKLSLSKQLRYLQDSLNSDQHACLSRPYIELNEQVELLKTEIEQKRASIDLAQGERDEALHLEREATVKVEACEASQKVNTIYMLRIGDLESRLQRLTAEKNDLKARLEEVSSGCERKDEVAEFKMTISNLHKEMRMMQQQLNSYKDAAFGSHSLRAEVQSITSVLDRKNKECKSLLEKSAKQTSEINLLKHEVTILRESEEELKLILDMYGRESTDHREVRELKEAECRAWAQVERLKAALDEHSLEQRVKVAIEAESECQQKLASAEAEIVELRRKIDSSERICLDLNNSLRTKSEEGDAYLAEIETIGQAYEDMQTQNQRLLQQISERDDYNIKLSSESIKAKQLQTSIQEEKEYLLTCIDFAKSLEDFYRQRLERLEEQARQFSEQLMKASEECKRHASALEAAKQKIAEADKANASVKASLDAAQEELTLSRRKMDELEEDVEKERFEKRRIREEIELLNSKVSQNHTQSGGSGLVEKLQEEIKEYKAILNCGVCHDRSKEVVITKCFHLFCSQCIQKNLENRPRKCPTCGVPFGQNDVRNVYI